MPRRPTEPYLRYYSLGGLGEVGMNCAVFESKGRLLVVDCGVTFPDSMAYGIDLIVPDFQLLHQEADRIEALVITHGHMDHIGAVPYLLEELDIPVYGPALAIEMIRRTLAERGLLEECELHVYDEEDVLQLGPFRLEFPPVNHSIPHSHSLVIQTEVGTFMHTGDFKVDHQPVGEAPFNVARFNEIGRRGVRALFSDSTNAEVDGHCPSERTAKNALQQTIREQSGRIFVALFSSNVFRMHSVLEAAVQTGRSVVLLGRSVENTLYAAQRVGAITFPAGLNIIDSDQARNLPDSELLFICTGTQAEPRAALTRLANDDYPRIKLREGDAVLFSARIIPGNERWVTAVYDLLVRKNIRLITPDDAPIHASGHGFREDLRLMMQMITPESIVPVHGDHRFQRAHAELAAESGIHDHFIIDNGQILEFTKDETKVVGQFETTRRVIDGTLLDFIDGPAFRQRRQIARSGVVNITILAGAESGLFLRRPDINAMGAFIDDEDFQGNVTQVIEDTIIRTWDRLSGDAQRDENAAAEAIRIAVRKQITTETQRRPIVIVRVYSL